MPYPHLPLAGVTNPQMGFLDDLFGAVALGAVVPCDATGTNVITLTPKTNQPSIAAYTTQQCFSFVAANTSNGNVTVLVSGLSAVKLFLAGGVTQAGSGDIVSGQPYSVMYVSTLDTGAGGFVVTSAIIPPSATTGKLLRYSYANFSGAATGTTVIPWDNSIPQNVEGDQYMNQTFSPTVTSSILVVEVRAFIGVAASRNVTLALFRSGSADAVAAVTQNIAAATAMSPMVLTYHVPSLSTAAINWGVRAGVDSASTLALNGNTSTAIFSGVGASSISTMEVLP